MNSIGLERSKYPRLPFKLFEDTPRSKIKEIYGIIPYVRNYNIITIL